MTVVAEPKPRQAAWPARPPRIRVRQEPPQDNTTRRPLTATLDHPLLLNEALITKLDMTIFTKDGLMAITKLCTVPVISRDKKRKTKLRMKGKLLYLDYCLSFIIRKGPYRSQSTPVRDDLT